MSVRDNGGTRTVDLRALATAVAPDLKVESRDKAHSRLVMGVFSDLQKAGNAMLALEERGFAPEDITLRLSKETRDVLEGRRVFRDQQSRTYVARAPIPIQRQRRWAYGLGTGALTGAILGVIAALISGSPEVTYVTVFGASFAASAVVVWALVGLGAVLGGAIGAIIGSASTQYCATDYDACHILEGALVGVVVHDDSEADAIARTFDSQGARLVSAA